MVSCKGALTVLVVHFCAAIVNVVDAVDIADDLVDVMHVDVFVAVAVVDCNLSDGNDCVRCSVNAFVNAIFADFA